MKNRIIVFLLLSLVLTGCKEKTYTITFNTDGGTVMESVILKKGESLSGLEAPSKEGYLFVNWSKDGRTYNLENPIKENITLTAKWVETPEIPNTYTVIFISNGYEEKTTVKENELIPNLKPNEKLNYNFVGWYLDGKEYNFNEKVTKDLVLVAKYEISTIIVTYDLDGGIGEKMQKIEKGTTPEIPEVPKKDGYRFLKWELNGEEFSFNTKVNEDITIKAVWDKIEYVKITYDTSGGDIIEPVIIEKHSRITDLPIPKKEGYSFKEWQNNGEPIDLDTIIIDDIVLKAIYN